MNNKDKEKEDDKERRTKRRTMSGGQGLKRTRGGQEEDEERKTRTQTSLGKLFTLYATDHPVTMAHTFSLCKIPTDIGVVVGLE